MKFSHKPLFCLFTSAQLTSVLMVKDKSNLQMGLKMLVKTYEKIEKWFMTVLISEVRKISYALNIELIIPFRWWCDDKSDKNLFIFSFRLFLLNETLIGKLRSCFQKRIESRACCRRSSPSSRWNSGRCPCQRGTRKSAQSWFSWQFVISSILHSGLGFLRVWNGDFSCRRYRSIFSCLSSPSTGSSIHIGG